MIKKNFRRVPLVNAFNVRDLGGYPCTKGNKIINYHSFLRADDLHCLNNDEIEYLINYGLAAVIDLRSKEEIKKFPDPFENSGKVKYINIPLITENISDVTRINTIEPENMMTAFYMSLIKDSGEAIKTVFEFMSEVSNGIILFHCTAGKDRTGITAMLLLMLAGVEDSDVIADYSVTYIYNSVNPVFVEILSECPAELLFSNADYIVPVIKYIRSEYKTADNYLKCIGVSDEAIHKIIKRLCG